jgi:hypothetical protein
MLDVLETLGLSPFVKIAFAFFIFPYGCCVELLDGTDGTLTIDMQNRFSDLFS